MQRALSRREIVVGLPAFAGGVLSRTHGAQGDPVAQQTASPESVAKAHGESLQAIGNALKKTVLISREGFRLLVALLVAEKIITEDQAKILLALGDLIYDVPSLPELKKKIDALLAAAKEKAGPVVETAIRIARNSVDFVEAQLENVGAGRLAFIVASDVTGVLMAAQVIANLKHPALMALGAGCAAVAASGAAFYQSKESLTAPKAKLA
jgi:hypothetical protein